VPAYKVASALVGVVAQRLVRNVCPECRTTYYPPADLLETIRYEGAHKRSFIRGQGCAKCHDTGFQGRTGVYELLACDQEVRRLIVHDATLGAIREWQRRNNVRTLFDEALRLAESGQTSLDEAMRVAFFD